ncbi:MAG: hypothetical protein SGARI_001169 [Bacillariaceae sp.]
MHRYDCTIFCFNALANVAEGEEVPKILTTMTVQPEALGSIFWLRWLCQWFIQQIETFQDEIMSLGKKSEGGGAAAGSASKKPPARDANQTDESFQKHEEEKLVAAGHCCVVLACLLTEAESVESEYSSTVKKMILSEMPVDKDGKATGVSVIVNTLKAFCNYYHLSLGELSLAVVAPVKRLILELEDIEIDNVDGDSQ